jgi:hypothetical protein
MKFFTLTMLASFLLLAAANPAVAQKRKLSDAELDKVTAGGAPAQSTGGVLEFQFQGKAGNTHTVNGSGTVAVKTDGVPLDSATLILQDGAQQNLRSMININAVNSRIQVLVNLNININSTVGAVHQSNTSLGH